jgi:serine/threonine protein kinase
VLDAESPLPLSRALPLCTHILRAFEDAHQAGVIHRDVKPHNVLLPHAGGVKVTDFGLARMGGNGDETVTQGVAGTLKYMSPEQVQGSADLDARSDLFSLGLLFFEVLTGRLPFAEDARDFDIMRTIVEEDLPGPRSIRPDLPSDLDRVVRRLLRRNPEERYASASETLADLEDLRSRPRLPARHRPPRRQRPPRRLQPDRQSASFSAAVSCWPCCSQGPPGSASSPAVRPAPNRGRT